MGNKRTPNSADYLHAIANSTTDALIVIDQDGLVLSWNRAAAKMFGYTAEEMAGKPLTPIIPEQFRKPHDQGVARVSAGGEQHVIGKAVELTGRRRNGEEFPLELTVSCWDQGGDRRFGAIIRDITERVEMGNELRRSQTRAQAIMASANDAIITADANGKVLSWNRAATDIFGHPENEMIGRCLTAIIPEKFRSAHEEGIERVSGGGEHHVIGHTVELAGLHQSGKEIPIELSLSTWTIEGEVFYSGIVRDITARKKDEKKLLSQKAKLAQRAAALKQLNEEVSSKNEQLQALSNKLAKYLSHQVYQNIFEGKKDVKIESYRKNLTIFFSDIQGFTELTDRVESEVLTNALNKYLNEMSRIAEEHGGTIDKFIGDAIMIFFGDPESRGEQEDAIACVKMAIAMRKKLAEMRRQWDVLGISKPLSVRMGINTGYCTVGNFGSEDRLDYTIVGGSVNLASRLETAAGVDEILVSEDTFSLIKDDIACEPKDKITVKGMAYPVMTYTVLDLIETLKAERAHIKTELEGFNLNIDFQKLKHTDKVYAREMLQKAMGILEADLPSKD
jgi:PAS domain S-box-containing protein